MFDERALLPVINVSERWGRDEGKLTPSMPIMILWRRSECVWMKSKQERDLLSDSDKGEYSKCSTRTQAVEQDLQTIHTQVRRRVMGRCVSLNDSQLP